MNQPIDVDPTLARPRSRLKPLLAVALVVLVAGVVGPRVLFPAGGASGGDTASFPEPGSPAVAPSSPVPVAVVQAPPALPAGTGRNPFASPVAAVAVVAPVVAAPVPTTVPAAPARSTARLRVLEISLDGSRRPLARVRVDDVAQTVTVGQTFARRYTLDSLDIPGRCGRFVAAGVRFTLCEGDERLA